MTDLASDDIAIDLQALAPSFVGFVVFTADLLHLSLEQERYLISQTSLFFFFVRKSSDVTSVKDVLAVFASDFNESTRTLMRHEDRVSQEVSYTYVADCSNEFSALVKVTSLSKDVLLPASAVKCLIRLEAGELTWTRA